MPQERNTILVGDRVLSLREAIVLSARHFDADYYLRHNDDVRQARVDAFGHFWNHGWREGRRPCADFDPAFYLATNPELAAQGINPFLHYLAHGRAAGRPPDMAAVLSTIRPAFDADHYLRVHADVRRAGEDPLVHYCTNGWLEGRNPNTGFDDAYYLHVNPEAANRLVPPFYHYLAVGMKEGRACWPPVPGAYIPPIALRFGNPQQQVSACDRLITQGYLAEAEERLAQLVAAPGATAEAKRLQMVCRQLRRWGIVETFKHSNTHADGMPNILMNARILRKPGARKILYVFTGLDRQVWISIHLLHQFLDKYDCHLVYLVDETEKGYLDGISGFGGDFFSAVAALRDFGAALGNPAIYCLGSSWGGYAALRYGAALNAAGILSFVPWTDLSSLDDIARMIGEPPPDLPPGVAVDMRQLLAAMASPPPVTLVFGAEHEDDAARCRHLGDLPCTTLVPVAGFGRHDVVSQTIAMGTFPALLDRLLKQA